MKKILIFRFSSLGDVLQTLSVAGRLGESWEDAEIHWATREEFAPLIARHPHIKKVWTLRKGASLSDVRTLGRELGREKFTHVYDAHNNLRTRLLGWQLGGFLGWRRWLGGQKFLRRSIYRIRRFFLFRFHWNLFPQPFSGQRALLEPLTQWGIPLEAPPVPQLYLDDQAGSRARQALPASWTDFVALAPSAAFQLKRWPLEYWVELIRSNPDTRFAILGGPEDGFLQDLVSAAPERVVNLAGRLSFEESAQVVVQSRALVSNDTGLMHVAEQTGKPCLALMGPAPFGFPSRPQTRIFELKLSCRPCSKHGQGPCVNAEFHKCMRGILPTEVARSLKQVLDA